jgi:MFS transporter
LCGRRSSAGGRRARSANSQAPLAPLSILRINGLGFSNVTQLVAFAGALALFFFLTLYMQNVLGNSPIQTGLAYLPFCFAVVVSAGISSQLLSRVGTRPVIVVGAIVAAGGLYWLSRIPVDGSYLGDLLPGMLVVALGGGIFVGVATAANAGVPADKAGLAAAVLTASQELGGALGLTIFTAVSTSRTNNLLSAGTPTSHTLTSGFQRALLGSIFLLAAAVTGLRATNTRGGTDTAVGGVGEISEVDAIDEHAVERHAQHIVQEAGAGRCLFQPHRRSAWPGDATCRSIHRRLHGADRRLCADAPTHGTRGRPTHARGWVGGDPDDDYHAGSARDSVRGPVRGHVCSRRGTVSNTCARVLEVPQPGDQDEVLPPAEDLVDGCELPGETDGLTHAGGLRRDIEAVDPGRPRVGRQERGQDVHHRGLARPVRAEQGEDAPRHLEVHAAQHAQLLVRLLQALHLDRRPPRLIGY